MSTEPGLGALIYPSPWGWIVCQSLVSPAPPLSPSRPSHMAVRGAGSCCWELKELAPGSSPALLAMKFLFSHPAHPWGERRTCLATFHLSCAFSSVSLTLPVPSPFWGAAGGWPCGLAPAGSLQGRSPRSALACGGAGTVAGQCEWGAWTAGSHGLSTLSALLLSLLAANICTAFA